MADDSSKLGIRQTADTVAEPASTKPSRKRVDYSALPELLADGVRSPLEDGPAYATSVIRAAIIMSKLKPGDAIRQDLMASALSLSKPPIREALRKLEAEQLVVFLQNRGFVVAKESSLELREAFEIRAILEPAAMRIAAPNLTSEDFDQARQIMKLLAMEPDYHIHYDLNLEFHLTLYRPSHRPHMLETIVRAHARTQRYTYRSLYLRNSVQKTPDDGRHEIMLDKLEAGDLDGACECLVLHLEVAAEKLLRTYQRNFELEEQSSRLSKPRRARG